jgi:hypothetical protein
LDPDGTIPGHIHDGLSDPNKSPDDANILDNSDLGQFASALQEAQCHAVQLESEIAKTKCRAPKTYQGDSKRTLHRREVACRVLASQGYHDVFTFMALKEKEISQQPEGDLGDSGCTNHLLPGRIEPEEELGGHHGNGTPPGPVHRAQCGGGADDGGECAFTGGECMFAEPCSPVPRPCPLPSPISDSPDQGWVSSDENEPCTLAKEEEESSGEGESPSFLHRKRSWIVDTNEHASEFGGIDSDNKSLGS